MADDVKNIVTLVVDGKEYGGWKSVNIQAGIERCARSFSLAVTRSWPGASSLLKKISPFDSCEIYIGNDLVLTGDVDETPVSYSADDISVSVNGRSKTARLVDCAALNDPGQWSGLKVEKIAAALASVYSVKVLADVSTGSAIDDHQILQGETAFESIDRLLQLRQLLATDTAKGELLLTQAGSRHSGASLVLGENILTGSAPLDFKEVYSEIICKGQRSATETEDDSDEALPALLTESSAVAYDSQVPYRRVTVIKQSGQADAATCRDQVQYEKQYRRARALAASYTTHGWRRIDGKLWLPNELVRVVDPVIGYDLDLLIVELSYSLAESGMTTALNVAPREGYLKQASTVAASAWAGVVAAGKSPDNSL
jgi:prophage tail gpP-like protein